MFTEKYIIPIPVYLEKKWKKTENFKKKKVECLVIYHRMVGQMYLTNFYILLVDCDSSALRVSNSLNCFCLNIRYRKISLIPKFLVSREELRIFQPNEKYEDTLSI